MAFAIYVIHPVVLSITGYATHQLVEFSPLWIAGSFAQTLALATAAAAILYLVVEMPCAAVQRLLLEPAATVLVRSAVTSVRASLAPKRVDDGDDVLAAAGDNDGKEALLLGIQ